MAEKHPHLHGFLQSVGSALSSNTGHVAEGGALGAAVGGVAGYAGAHFLGNPQGPGYNVAGHHISQEAAFAAGGVLVGGLLGAGGGAFFNHLKNKSSRDYVVVVDRSGHMQGHLWAEATAVVAQVAGEVCKIDKDGVTLILFADRPERFANITDPANVMQKLQTTSPGGNCHLAPALQSALTDHFSVGKKETTILVVTAGEPADVNPTVDVLRDAANRIKHAKELSVTFIQVGDNTQATAFLQFLDKSLGAKHDIVDTLKDEDFKKLNLRK